MFLSVWYTYIGHTYIADNYIAHDYIGHNYIDDNNIAHDCIGHNCTRLVLVSLVWDRARIFGRRLMPTVTTAGVVVGRGAWGFTTDPRAASDRSRRDTSFGYLGIGRRSSPSACSEIAVSRDPRSAHVDALFLNDVWMREKWLMRGVRAHLQGICLCTRGGGARGRAARVST